MAPVFFVSTMDKEVHLMENNFNKYKYSNIVWNEYSEKVLSFCDGYITAVQEVNKERANELRESLHENLDMLNTGWKQWKCYLGYDNQMSFSIVWRTKDTNQFVMNGGLIFHHSTNSWSIHT